MLMAASMHIAAGFFNSDGGFEFPMTLGIATVALTVSGPGRFSLDYPPDNPWIGITALIVGVAITLTLIARQRAYAKAAG